MCPPLSLGTHGTIDDGAKHKRMGEKLSSHALQAYGRRRLPSSPNQGQRSLSSSSGALTFNTLRGEVEVGGTSCKWSRGQLPHVLLPTLSCLLVSLWTPINVYGRLYRLSQSLFATDIIYRYLALAPSPLLVACFLCVQFIWSSVGPTSSG